MSVPSLFDAPLGYLIRHTDDEQALEAVQNYFQWERLGRVICSDPGVAMAHLIMDTGNVAAPHLSVVLDLSQFSDRDLLAVELLAVQYDGLPTVIISGAEIADLVERGGIVAVYLIDEGVVFVPRLGELHVTARLVRVH